MAYLRARPPKKEEPISAKLDRIIKLLQKQTEWLEGIAMAEAVQAQANDELVKAFLKGSNKETVVEKSEKQIRRMGGLAGDVSELQTREDGGA